MKTSTQEAVLLSHEQMATAMRSPTHMEAWLESSGRKWLVLNSVDLMKALTWPDGVNILMQVIAAYRDHRLTQPSGRTEIIADALGHKTEVPIVKTDVLEVEELDRAIRYMAARMLEIDPKWSLENPGL
jgi:hypothetical protein